MFLDRNVKLDTGRKFLSISGSREGFFNNGLTMADLSVDGNFPADKHRFTMKVITVSSYGRMLARSREGMGSLSHDAFDEFFTIGSISSFVVCLKLVSLSTVGVNIESTSKDISAQSSFIASSFL